MSDLTIVTSCYNYGSYLREWAESIVALNTHPDRVVIVNNGSNDDTPQQVEDAFGIICMAGIPCSFHHIERTDFGSARNFAVDKAETEWVQHLDADDMAMLHMLDDFLQLASDADVVAMGYERCGDLSAGPRNRKRIYRDTQGQSALSSMAPASGVSPFRKRFWEQSPYRTDMKGGWDTALWLGFAHLGARFQATKRPCFWYRQHAGSIFNTRRLNEMCGQEVGTKLQSLRRGDQGVTVIVPFMSDEGQRDRVWDWVQRYYEIHHPEWQIVEARISRGAWNKGAAVNRAIGVSTGSVLVVADADCIISPEALQEAVRIVEEGAPWVVPHRKVHRLNERSSGMILDQDPGQELDILRDYDRQPYVGYAGGGIFVVERAKFDFINGFPEEFDGWGAEDEAIAVIMDTLLGDHIRMDYDLWHLWHPKTKRSRSSGFRANQTHLKKYVGYQGDPEGMWAKVTGRRVVGRYVHSLPDTIIRPLSNDIGHNGVLDQSDLNRIQQRSRLRTLQIREEQRIRNEEANLARSFERRRLEEASQRLKNLYPSGG